MRFDRVLASARNVRRYAGLRPIAAGGDDARRPGTCSITWCGTTGTSWSCSAPTTPSSRRGWRNSTRLEPPAQDFEMVQVSGRAASRAGVLGHAGFLTLTGNPNETSPTARGLFVREHFLCQHVPPPPPGVDTNLPAVTAEKPMTTRERLAMHAPQSELRGLPQPDRPDRLRPRRLRQHRQVSREGDAARFSSQRDSVTNQPRPRKDYRTAAGHQRLHPGNPEFEVLDARRAWQHPGQRSDLPALRREADIPIRVGRHEEESGPAQLDALCTRVSRIRLPVPRIVAVAGDIAGISGCAARRLREAEAAGNADCTRRRLPTCPQAVRFDAVV